MSQIPLDSPLVGEKEKKYLTDVIDSGWLTWLGPFVTTFEQRFREFIGTKYAVSVCNGSAALLLALKGIGLRPDDKVIVPIAEADIQRKRYEYTCIL